ncbi:MAG: AAA family ATPase [Campylobacterota bacterium]|nr:AAA family ATPase [Campylobacterota bacterium]
MIENIGIIKQADVTIDGLTVIAGGNDSGKSTVGKMLFSIIKSISRYKEDLEEDKEKNIKQLVDRIYFILRRNINFNENIDIKDMFYPISFMEDINRNSTEAVNSRIDFIESYSISKIIYDRLNDLKKIVAQDDNKNETIKRAFKKIIYSEFAGEVINKHIKENELSYVNIKEYENEILNIDMTNINDINFKLNDDLYFNDSTLIETPMILNFNESIENSKSYFEIRDKNDRLNYLGMPNIAFHIKDIDSKLKESIYNDENLFKNNELSQKISDIVNGEMKFIPKEKEFIYIKKDGKKYKNINTASGIKSFGILQMLFNSGLIDERSIIIIDEPEVHLHPKWQLKYAELIVLLVKNNINILVTTHSPYMIEALELFSQKEKISSNFYIAQKNKNDTIISNVNNNLEKIYETLSEPFSVLEKISITDNFKW